GQILAWGQYVVGLSLTLLVLTPVFGMDPIAGALIEITFEGGHGTAAGMADTFRELNLPAGADTALGLATVGLVSGVIFGVALINWARRTGRLQVKPLLDSEVEE
ncbi:sodium:glutamate symporter, partial [Escherichia coli]|nr:sodium:glutamate symporter [Escherichia coli]